jgi:hypothetical protein
MKHLFWAAALLLTITSCAELTQVAQQYATQQTPLTEADVANGLKQALKVGTDTAVMHLAKTDGYFGNQLYKILLPPEADVMIKNASKIPGGSKLVNDVILSINRSAEDAAKEAAPIFSSAIQQMSIADAWNILRGSDNAATEYLRKNTYTQLVNLYSPKIKGSLDKPLIAGISATTSWNTLTSKWNTLAGTTAGKIAGFTPVNVDLNNYLTKKALDGLFLQIAAEEKSIRQDPVARVTDLMKRVFAAK